MAYQEFEIYTLRLIKLFLSHRALGYVYRHVKQDDPAIYFRTLSFYK